MIQWGKPAFLSFGIHIDYYVRYVDFHLIFVIVTIGKPECGFEDFHTWCSSRNNI